MSHIMDHTGPSTDPADIAEATIREDGEAEHDPSPGKTSRWKTYIITEFCIGGSLRDILRQPELVAATKQVRSSAAQLCVLKQVVEGMKYLHSIGVVHNDLKASNVLLHPSSETNCRWSAKIGDFGIARRIPPGAACVPLDIMNGTVSHMAPELLNDKFMSRATDVYSFEVLLWEIAAQGETPFSGIDAVDVAAAVVKHPPPAKVCGECVLAVGSARHAVLARGSARTPEFRADRRGSVRLGAARDVPEGGERVVHAHPRGDGGHVRR